MEGLASDDSVRLIEEHLAVCDDCRKELEELKKGKDEEESRKTHLDEAAPIVNVRKILKRKKVLTVIAAVSLTLLGILIYLMIKPPSLSCLDSELYSKADQQKAMRSVKRDFLSLALEGCRLYSLSFAGDEACLREADHRPYDEVIVIRAEFRAPGSGGWNANGIYHWDWILAKNSRGKWVVIDKGDC